MLQKTSSSMLLNCDVPASGGGQRRYFCKKYNIGTVVAMDNGESM
jgi:hypothetical protein